METPELPQELLIKLAGQVVQDPGVPVPNPTVSAWQEPAHPIATTQSKSLPQLVDFAIIGSGITGCSAAKTILECDLGRVKKVTVFEARSLTTGATSRNGGFLLSHAPQFYGRFADAFGAEAAKQIAIFCDRTLEEIIQIAKAENLDKVSEIREVTMVATYEDEEGFAEASRSVRMYEEAVPAPREKYVIIDGETAKNEYHFKKSKGALVVKSHVCWPYRLITNLLQLLLERYPERFTVETQTAVTSITVFQDSNIEYPYVLATPRGTVRAAKVFHCVNGFTGHLLPKLRGPLFPTRLSMSTQKPGPQWENRPFSWLFHSKQSWDPNTTLVEQGLYWMQQNAETGDLFLGGDLQRLDDFIASDDSVISADSAGNLTTLLPKRIFNEGWTNPITNESLYSSTALHRVWSGIIGMTADQVPIVGSVPTSVSGRNIDKGEWIAAGFNGYGMCQAWLSGQAIARMALGEPKPEWLPDVYLSTEKRLTDKAMGPDAALASFFFR
ncbi:FAD dependent oxidoreductase [Talaromyces proteolyticus]|uniref:FAD dependent oxidoreductase n=1 Tax=Talaromyces proteolyticus TaxID=1131652 RepID=A0AAD4PV60_9EURO|nr:FAD dependent oxidoreductase [Talaromyces proteolyticus]KAH8696170.1 FAD dependent oxidoreductase [Talaromyces proteolyticus]